MQLYTESDQATEQFRWSLRTAKHGKERLRMRNTVIMRLRFTITKN